MRNYLKRIMDRQINRISRDGVIDKMDLITLRLQDVQGVSLSAGINS